MKDDDKTAASDFIEKMEQSRRQKPCNYIVDMRDKVPAICKEYTHQGKHFYMDDISYGIFKKSLQEHNGVFTLGAYEDITDGAHTFKGIKHAKQAESLAAISKDSKTSKRLLPIEFGYFRKRLQERLQLVTELIVTVAGNSYKAHTRDMSLNGMQIFMPLISELANAEEVRVQFLTDGDSKHQASIPYAIIRAEKRDKYLALALRRIIEDDDPYESYLQELITTNKNHAHIDSQEVVALLQGRTFEKLYVDNCMSLPMFFIKKNNHDHLDTVGLTTANTSLVKIFETRHGKYDFSPIDHAPWLMKAINLMHEDQSSVEVIVTVIKSPTGFVAIGSNEFSAIKDLPAAWLYGQQQAMYKFFKLTLSPVYQIPEERLTELLKPLSEIDEKGSDAIMDSLSAISCLGSLHDITDTIEAMLGDASFSKPSVTDLEAHIEACINRPLHDVSENKRLTQPNYSRFGYQRQRKEERYLIEMSVNVKAGSIKVNAHTSDLSVGGLGLMFEEPQAIHLGQEVSLTFTDLQKRFPKVRLKKIAFTVSRVSAGKRQFGLSRTAKSKEDFELSNFLNTLIQRNKGKLGIEISETNEEVMTRCLETLYAADLHTIPFFMALNGESDFYIDSVAANSQPNTLFDYFAQSKREIDISFLTNKIILNRLHTLCSSSSKSNTSSSLHILTYHTAITGELVTKADFEFKNKDEHKEFIKTMIKNGSYRIIKVSIISLPKYSEAYTNQLFASLYSQSMSHAKRFQVRFLKLWAVGELIDVSREYLIAMKGANYTID